MNRIVGYITSDNLSSGFVSHQIQNSGIRQFLHIHKKNFMLSWTEYKDAAPLVFNSLLSENFYDGICFYSFEQLFSFQDPYIYLEKLRSSDLWIGFARESLYFQSEKNYDELLRIFWLAEVTRKQVI